MSFVNICRDNTDPFYRYKMPVIQSKVEGRGNGIKTAIVNLDEVARALARPASYVVKYFGYELGAQTTDKGGRYIVNGAHDALELQDCLDGFISKFVLCPSCKNPETEILLKEKGVLQRDCKACGSISYLDNRHKLISYILKTIGTGKKGKKAATASAIAGGQSITEIAANHAESGSGVAEADASVAVGDDDDALTKKIKAEAAGLEQKQLVVNDDDWAVDMSKEAIEARARELEGLSIGSEKAEHVKFNEFGEWLLKEAESELPSDVDIYKKIVELEISGQPETVQVLAQVLFNNEIIAQIEAHLGLLAKLINHQEEFENAFLGGLERYLGLENQALIPVLPKILMVVYDNDLVSEEAITAWGSKVSKKYVPKDVSKKVRKAAKPFVKWLQEAEEEESDEDDE